jgi:uncharacterized protein YdgA (DUF945 family)
MKNKAIATFAIIALGAATWLGLGYASGYKIESALRSLATPAAAGAPASAWTVAELQHERGVLASSGEFQLVYADGEERLPLRITYSVDHKALPAAAARLSWKLQPEGRLATDLKSATGMDMQVTGAGTVGYDGAIRSDFQVPSVSARSAGRNLNIAASSGSARFDATRLEALWKLDQLTMRGRGEALEVRGTNLSFDVDHATGSQAQARLAIERIDTAVGSFEGLDLTAESRRNADRMDTTVSQSLRRVEAMGQAFSDLQLKWEVNGLHAESLEKLVLLAQHSGDSMSLTLKERLAAAEAIETLLQKGLSFGMPTLTGKGRDGGIEASFQITLAAAQGTQTALGERVQSSGRASVKGTLLSPEQMEMATNSGYAVAQGDTLTTGYQYEKGVLKVNDQTLDASFIDAALSRADEQVQALLESMKSRP